MTGVFIKILNMSISAGWIVLSVLLLRLLMKKAPKWTGCVLWGIVALRLLIPFSLPSSISLVPSGQVIPQDITTTATPAIYSGIPAVNSAVNPLFVQQLAPETQRLDSLVSIGTIVWLVGVGVMAVWGLIAWLRVYGRVRICLHLRENIYLCDNIDSPFVFGLLKPRIYLPSGLEDEQRTYVLDHEQAHIRRRDHWWKPLAYLLLTVYWFQPLMWVAYILLCRDIEQACDEKVVAKLSPKEKKGYAEALLSCSIRHRMISVCPVAFGEVGAKERIKGVLRYQKPSRWVLLVACAVCTVMALCFLTDPIPCAHAYQNTTMVDATCAQTGVERHVCGQCGHVFEEKTAMLDHTYDQGVVISPSSCIQTGSLLCTCTGCNAQTTQSLELGNHVAAEPYFVQEANCTQTGEERATCGVCQAVFVTKIIPVNGVHDLQETVIKAATCTANGEGLKTCTRCDYQEQVIYEKTGHSFGSPFDYIGASCRASGIRRTYCTECHYYVDEEIPRYDHRWVTATGGTYVYCSGCGMPKSGGSSGQQSNNQQNTWPVITIWP